MDEAQVTIALSFREPSGFSDAWSQLEFLPPEIVPNMAMIKSGFATLEEASVMTSIVSADQIGRLMEIEAAITEITENSMTVRMLLRQPLIKLRALFERP